MYPEINTLIRLLHQKGISTFLVTNAQFPDAIKYVGISQYSICIVCHGRSHSHSRNLIPVTQLYVSVDASMKESLKKIDRPLFRDFWPRFIASLEALAEKVSDKP